MAITSKRSVSIQFSEDLLFNQTFEAVDNAASPGEIENVVLATGPNTITPPTGTTAVTILPPIANTIGITLKGVTGDTGVPLGLVDPSTISLAGLTSFVLTAVSGVTIRLIWS